MVETTTEEDSGQQHAAAVAYDLSQGAERWRLEFGDGQQRGFAARPGGPVVADGVAVFGWTPAASAANPTGGGGGTVVAIDVATGTRRWEVSLTGSQAEAESLAALTETTVVLASFRSMSGLDRRTGEQSWASEPADRAGGLGGSGGDGRAAVDGELVVGLSPIGLVAFDARTGETRWRIAGTDSSLPHSLTAAAGVVVGAVGNGPTREVRVIDAVTGKDLWTKPGEPSYGGLWAIGDGTFVARLPADGTLVAYHLAGGGQALPPAPSWRGRCSCWRVGPAEPSLGRAGCGDVAGDEHQRGA